MTKIRTYSEVAKLETFEERFDYLKLSGGVGRATFAFDRYLNQQFYGSREWELVRQHVIIRDQGCDLGVPGYEIHTGLLIHHINPMTPEDLVHKNEWILDSEFLILTMHRTHNNLHFGTKKLIPNVVIERSPRDTKLW